MKIKVQIYRGIIDPNHIASGKIKLKPGETFLVQPDGMTGFIAYRYSPGFRTGVDKFWNDFELLGRGTSETCLNLANGVKS